MRKFVSTHSLPGYTEGLVFEETKCGYRCILPGRQNEWIGFPKRLVEKSSWFEEVKIAPHQICQHQVFCIQCKMEINIEEALK